MRVSQSRVLLTGASGGIGAAAASHLLKAGACVMLAGRSPAKLSAQARALVRDLGVERARVEWYAADLTRVASLGPLADVAAQWQCNVLVHGAGTPGFGRLESFDTMSMAKVLHLNLFVPMLLTQAMLPHLRQQPQARIVFIGSAVGRLGLPGFSVYSASKFGLRGFAESMRRELGDTRIRVQYLAPRGTRTDFNSEQVERYNDATGARMDSADTVARALVQLIESGAAERFLGFPEKLAVLVNGLAPAWLDGAFAKHRSSLEPLSQPPKPVLEWSEESLGSIVDSHSLLKRTL